MSQKKIERAMGKGTRVEYVGAARLSAGTVQAGTPRKPFDGPAFVFVRWDRTPTMRSVEWVPNLVELEPRQ